MTPEEIGKKQDQTDQTNTWFQNRGLFSGDYVQVCLPPDSWHTDKGERTIKPT